MLNLMTLGRALNIILYVISVVVYSFILAAFAPNISSSDALGIILFLSLIDLIVLLPTFISHTGWKYIIFIANLLFAPTIIGWFLLLIIANVTNKSALREQEMNYLLRKVSDKVGE
ncbi:hypothetical protein K6V43_10415 [Streptococcus suis]|nr:hypothetical protein [Streptococcus suis]